MALELLPSSDLIFKGPFNAVSTTTLKLINTGSGRLAYKIKTTAPKRYCVKPNSGFLDANANATVQVMLQPQITGQQDDRGKHKFMVQWVVVPNAYSDDVEVFWKQDLTGYDVRDSKLKCVFSEEQPAAVVPNDSSGNNTVDNAELINTADNRNPQNAKQTEYKTSNTNQRTTTTNSSRDGKPLNIQFEEIPRQEATDDSNRSRFKNESDTAKEEIENVKARNVQQEIRQRNVTSGRIDNPVLDRIKQTPQAKNSLIIFGISFNETLVLVAFVIALLFGLSLGYIMFSCSD